MSVRDIAEYLGLSLRTTYRIIEQGGFPEPDGYPGNRPCWYRVTVDGWCRLSGEWVSGGS